MPRSDVFKNGELVNQLAYAVLEGEKNIKHIPNFMRQVIETGAWRKRWMFGRPVEHPDFLSFVNTAPAEGMGWSTVADKERVASLLREDLDVLQMWRTALTAEAGGDRQSAQAKSITDNVSNAYIPKHGNSLAYTLDRLHRERRDLYTKVVAKKLSANAAAIAAGWRKPSSPLEQLRKAWAKATTDERETFLTEIGDSHSPT